MASVFYVTIKTMEKPKPLILIILDGFGVSLEKEGNPVAQAKTPTFDEIERNFPFMTLQASGVAVGLPWGEAGNSEVGHLTIGSGRAIYHHLPRIINAIYDGSFFKNEALLGATEQVRKNNSNLHIAGLISSGSVHSYIDHLLALLEFTKREGIKNVFVHVFTDGKDAPPKEGAKFLSVLEERFAKEWPNVKLASVTGRFYALDRDEKWERVQEAYELLTEGRGEKTRSIPEYLQNSYAEDTTDEFIKPAAVTDESGRLIPRVGDNDALIFSDFREDSMREITHAFTDDVFDHFPRKKLQNLYVATMTEYEKGMRASAAFPQLDIEWPLSRVLGEAQLRHIHIAETQKYAHVTYFFNSGKEKPFLGEERVMIPSLTAAHFDEVPEMKAAEITAKILESFQYDVIIANFANADMVGHSGNFQSAVRAVEILDSFLGQIMKTVLDKGGAMIVTADHGNIELKRDVISGEKRMKHSINPVPLYLVGKELLRKTPRTEEEISALKSEPGGILTDIAPTILELLQLQKPREMTGISLLQTLVQK